MRQDGDGGGWTKHPSDPHWPRKGFFKSLLSIFGPNVSSLHVLQSRALKNPFVFPIQALLYFIHVMDHITVKEYVIVYFHTLTGEHNHLDSDFLKNLYDVVDIKSVWTFTLLSQTELKSFDSYFFLSPCWIWSVNS